MSEFVGLIAGTVFYHKDYFAQAEKKTMETEYGRAVVLISGRWAYVPRHGLEGEDYIPAFRINHPANLAAFKQLGIREVIGVNSSGSLRPSLEPGSVVLPSDYICLSNIPTIFNNYPGHITPCLNEKIRSKLSQAADAADVHLVEGGVYWQNPGPRLETRAEIQLQSHYADMVGMTLASEATIAQEMEVDYAALCSVDNHAHGLSPKTLTAQEITANAAANADRIFKIIEAYPAD